MNQNEFQQVSFTFFNFISKSSILVKKNSIKQINTTGNLYSLIILYFIIIIFVQVFIERILCICRLSNVTPIHPKLGPGREEGGRISPPPPRLYPHNTYHGHTPHHRTPLPGLSPDLKPLRFTDSPQHAPGYKHGRYTQ